MSRFYAEINSDVELGSNLTQSFLSYASNALGANAKENVILRKVEDEGARDRSGVPVLIVTENDIPKGVLKFFTRAEDCRHGSIHLSFRWILR